MKQGLWFLAVLVAFVSGSILTGLSTSEAANPFNDLFDRIDALDNSMDSNFNTVDAKFDSISEDVDGLIVFSTGYDVGLAEFDQKIDLLSGEVDDLKTQLASQGDDVDDIKSEILDSKLILCGIGTSPVIGGDSSGKCPIP